MREKNTGPWQAGLYCSDVRHKLGQKGMEFFDYQTEKYCLLFKEFHPLLFALMPDIRKNITPPAMGRYFSLSPAKASHHQAAVHSPRSGCTITMRFKKRNAL